MKCKACGQKLKPIEKLRGDKCCKCQRALPEFLSRLNEQAAARISIEAEEHWEEDDYDRMEDGPYLP